MNKKISVGITAALILVAVTITFTATMIYAMNGFNKKFIASSQKQLAVYERLSEADKIIRQNFYDQIDDTALSQDLLEGYINGLDSAYSEFLTAEEISLRSQQSRGTTVSFGIEATKDPSGYLNVSRVYLDSPADKSEIKAGDIITKIGDTDVKEAGYDEAVKLLYGVEGSKVEITYLRDDGEGSTEETSVELYYASIEVNTVTGLRRDDVYYIRISQFWETTPTQLGRVLREAENLYNEDQIVGIVIDVRGVHGGYNKTVVSDMLTLLMPTGTLYSGIYQGGVEKVIDTSSNEQPLQLPMTVLVNAGTAGFAELFAAVLGDKGNVRIIGKPTAGHGTLEVLYMLSDGSGVNISVALLKTGKGVQFNETGVPLDFEVDVPEDFIMMAEPEAEMDPQFQKAIAVLRSLR